MCMYKTITFSIKTWTRIEKWINEKHIEAALGYKNLVGNKTQYCSDKFKERRHEIQDCEDFQPCRKYIAEELGIPLITKIKTVKAAELKTIFGFNQLDPIITKQQSIGLRIRKTFPIEEII